VIPPSIDVRFEDQPVGFCPIEGSQILRGTPKYPVVIYQGFDRKRGTADEWVE